MIRISEAEFEVMKVVWEVGEVTSQEIIKRLQSDKWNANTIRTLIKRLYDKGALKVVKQEGRTYSYQSNIDEKRYKLEATKELLNKWYDDSLEEFLYQYCRDNHIKSEELKEVLRILNDRDKKNRDC